MNISQASKEGNLVRVRELLAQGANIDEKNRYGYTPLHLASEYGHLEVVKYLISQGANYSDLLEELEKSVSQKDEERREQLEKIVLDVADLRVKFIQ